MRRLKVPGRIIGKVYRLPVMRGKPCRTSLDTLYPMHYGKVSDSFARPTSDDPEFHPYEEGDIDIDGRGRDGLPAKSREEQYLELNPPNLDVMLRRILKWGKLTRLHRGAIN